jgi:hypothetical protein
MASFALIRHANMCPVFRVSTPSDNLRRLPFNILLSFLMLVVLHVAGILKALCNYAIAKATQ